MAPIIRSGAIKIKDYLIFKEFPRRNPKFKDFKNSVNDRQIIDDPNDECRRNSLDCTNFQVHFINA